MLTPYTDLRSADAIIKELLYVSPTRKLLYVADARRDSLRPDNNMQHLSCFIAGLFALGAVTIPDVDPRHAWAAEGLAHTCWLTYAESATGLGPERVHFRNTGAKWVDEVAAWEEAGRPGDVPPGVRDAVIVPESEREYKSEDPRYLLRPEVCQVATLCAVTDGLVDFGELLHFMAHDWRLEVAGPGMGDLRGDREALQDR